VADVVVTESHKLGIEGAKRALEPFSADLSKYGMSLHWKGSEADLKGTGASGSVVVTDTQVTVTVKLGMMAKVAGIKPDKLHDSIQRRVRAALSGESSPA
jgi:putative polyhydroxyalkanoate system protein